MAKFTADAYIGNMASRLGKGGTHVWDFYGLAQGTPWCAAEISYTFNKIGAKSKWYGGKPVFYVPYAQEWMAKHYNTIYDYRGKGSLKQVQKGDIIIFMWSRGSRDHIGACRKTTGSAKTISTIEGNTSGGKVANRERAKANIYAVYRPPWDGSEPSGGLDVDGELGPETYKAFQRWLGVKQTGKLDAGTIRAFQGRMNIPITGAWDKHTRCALQRYLNMRNDAGLVVDGDVGYLTVCALQEYLNKVLT